MKTKTKINLILGITLGFLLGFAGQQTALAYVYTPFGGTEVSTVVGTGICPAHVLVKNADLASTQTFFGVFVPTVGGVTYDYQNLYTPLTPILGGYLPVPVTSCLTPYKVYPLYLNGLFYMAGTGAL